jgi:hypothetical protein
MATLLSLRTRLREAILDDVTAPEQWSDSVLTDNINEALRQACFRARLLSGRVTFATTIGVALYELGNAGVANAPDILQIKSINDDTNAVKLFRTTTEELIDLQYNLNDQGTPTHYAEDDEQAADDEFPVIRLYPVPDAATTYTVRYIRMPAALSVDGDIPEIKTVYHDWLLYGAAWLCYEFQDEDSNEIGRAQYFENKFTERFGPMPLAHQLRQRQQRNYLTVVVDPDENLDRVVTY